MRVCYQRLRQLRRSLERRRLRCLSKRSWRSRPFLSMVPRLSWITKLYIKLVRFLIMSILRLTHPAIYLDYEYGRLLDRRGKRDEAREQFELVLSGIQNGLVLPKNLRV